MKFIKKGLELVSRQKIDKERLDSITVEELNTLTKLAEKANYCLVPLVDKVSPYKIEGTNLYVGGPSCTYDYFVTDEHGDMIVDHRLSFSLIYDGEKEARRAKWRKRSS